MILSINMSKSSDSVVVRIVDKWDRIKGKAYVIFDENNRVIAFGKHTGKSKRFYIKKHKNRIHNRELSHEIEFTPKVKPKHLKSIKRKFPEGKRVSWRIRRKRISNLQVGDLFQVQAKCKSSSGETFYLRSHQLVFDDKKDVNFALSEIRHYISGSDSIFEVDSIYPIVWSPSEIFSKHFIG